MTLQHQYRPINPRLGTHYAVFASAMASVVLILAMLEQLGTQKLWLSHFMIVSPMVLYAGVAIMTRTLDIHEFFSAGRRVPAVFGGLSLAVTAIGGVGFFALTGCLYLIGFDAFALALGWGAGFAVCAVLFTPFLRKSGAYTLPGFFRQRFNNRSLGMVAALFLLPPVLLLLAAEIRIGAFVTSLFVSLSFELAIVIGSVIVAAIAIMGGMRSVSWTQSVLYIVIIGAYLVPVTMLSLELTNLPLPQLTMGNLFERLSSQELAIGATQSGPVALEAALPGEQPEPALKPFLAAFAALSQSDFILLVFCFTAGTATLPSLLMRAGTAPSVFESRRTIGWGVIFFGLFLVSAPAYAAFTKFITLQQIAEALPGQLPDWIAGLRDAGLAEFSDRNSNGRFEATEMLVSRDGVTLALPIIAGYPFILVVLVAAGGISATLAAAIAHAFAAGTAIGEELLGNILNPSATPGRRLFYCRIGIIAAAVSIAWLVSVWDFDILPSVAWAMSLSAATFFPALSLSIWWPRITLLGALAALIAGFGVSAGYIFLTGISGQEPWFGISHLLAGTFGVPAGFAAGIGVSYLTPAPNPAVKAIGDEIRDPSGETLYDRVVRLSVAADAANDTEPEPDS